jgi:uncharacterized membrane protein (UPF0127 family)
MSHKPFGAPVLSCLFGVLGLLTFMLNAPLAAEELMGQSPEPQFLPITARAKVAGQKIDLEVAVTPSQKSLGMMGRPPLSLRRGMLFVYDPPQPVSFWMKNVNHPLDLLFINNGRVRAIAANAPPCRTERCTFYGPGARPMQYVLELGGGSAKQLGIRPGSKIGIEFFNSQSQKD